MMYLHVCDIKNQISREHPRYDPMFKVRDFSKNLEYHFNHLFVPENFLSLDESLVRAFVWTEFNVRIIKKSERYGIKIYVAVDAYTDYVIK